MTDARVPHPADPKPTYRRGLHWAALFGAVFTWPLLLAGGRVTTYRVGMAVPDWPTTFGINMFIYNFWNSPWGVYVEHIHRLYGAAVGMVTIVLSGWFLLADRRGWMKGLGVLALLLVVAQGVLGGLRVRLNSTAIAAVHGCTAQLFFALTVALCVLAGRGWIAAGAPRTDPDHLRRRALVTLILIYAQIVAGALLRHFGAGLVIHAVMAAAVWGHAALLVWRVERSKTLIPELVPSGRAMALLVTAQVALGVVAWWMLRPIDGIPRPVSTPQAWVRTGHLANGALLLASAVVLTLRSFRTLAPRSTRTEEGPALSPEAHLELVA
jgi:cytochrome c oxidase assembly protein subunit 15